MIRKTELCNLKIILFITDYFKVAMADHFPATLPLYMKLCNCNCCKNQTNMDEEMRIITTDPQNNHDLNDLAIRGFNQYEHIYMNPQEGDTLVLKMEPYNEKREPYAVAIYRGQFPGAERVGHLTYSLSVGVYHFLHYGRGSVKDLPGRNV